MMTLQKTILKLVVKFLLNEILDGLEKLWDSSEKVLIKVLIRFLKVKIKIAIKSNREKVGRMQLSDQKHKIKFLLEVLNYKPKFWRRKKKL